MLPNIKLWLFLRGIKQAHIAKDLGISRQAVWNAVSGNNRSHRVIQWLEEHGYGRVTEPENQDASEEPIKTAGN